MENVDEDFLSHAETLYEYTLRGQQKTMKDIFEN
jgi:hypothetical protein